MESSYLKITLQKRTEIMEYLRVGIIDSGIDTGDAQLMRFVEKGVNVKNGSSEYLSYHDNIGHGTACAHLITRSSDPNKVRLYIYKLFDKDSYIDLELFNNALEIARHDKINILNCSFGSIDPAAKEIIGEKVTELICNNTIIISAWNDEGYTTWPANCEGVVSIKSGDQKSQLEWGWERNKKDHFIFRGTKQRVKWKDNSLIFIGGSSFATALCTAQIAQEVLNGKLTVSFENVHKFLRQGAVSKINIELQRSEAIPWNKFIHNFKKVGIYPFTKETHSFVRFKKKLPYEICWVADVKGGRAIGNTLNNVLPNCDDDTMVVGGLPKNPGDIDSIIIGYLDQASSMFKNDLLSETLQYALDNNLNVFSFLLPTNEEERWQNLFLHHGIVLSSPVINFKKGMEIINSVEEKKAFDTPIVGIFGTSAKQGKFTLQLALRYELLKRKIFFGQLSTEHQAGCFGIDFTFPSGYGAEFSLQMPLEFHIPILRRVLSEMDKSGYEFILVGGQSGLLTPNPYYYGNFPAEHFFTAVIPDHVILITNNSDPPELIERIKRYIYSKTGQNISFSISFDDIKTKGVEKVASAIVDHLLPHSKK